MKTMRSLIGDPEEDEGETISAFASATMGFVVPQQVALPPPSCSGGMSLRQNSSPMLNEGDRFGYHPQHQQHHQSQLNWQQHNQNQIFFHGQDPPPQEQPHGQLHHPYRHQQYTYHDESYGLDQPSYLQSHPQLHSSHHMGAYPQMQLPDQNNQNLHSSQQNQIQQYHEHFQTKQLPGSLRGLASIPYEVPNNQYPKSKKNSLSVASRCNRSHRTIESSNRLVTFHDSVVNHQGGNPYHDDDPGEFSNCMEDITYNESIDVAPLDPSPTPLSKEAPSTSFVSIDSMVASDNSMESKQNYSSNKYLPRPHPKWENNRSGKGTISRDCRSLPGTNAEKKKKSKSNKNNIKQDAVPDAAASSDIKLDEIRGDEDSISEQKKPRTLSLKEKYQQYSSSRSLPPKSNRKTYYNQDDDTETESDEADDYHDGNGRFRSSSSKSTFNSQTDRIDPEKTTTTTRATMSHDIGYSSFDELLAPASPSVNSTNTEIERSLEETATEDEAEYYRKASSKTATAVTGLFARKGGGMSRFFSSGESTSMFSISSASSRSGMSVASKDVKVRGSRYMSFSKNQLPQRKLILVASVIIVALCVHAQFSQYWDRDTVTSLLFQSSENKVRRAQESIQNGFLSEDLVSYKNGADDDSEGSLSPGTESQNASNGNDENNTVVATSEEVEHDEQNRNPDEKFIEHVGGTSHIPFFEQLMNPSYSEFNGSEHLTKFSAEERVVEKLHSPDLYGLKDNWDPIELDREIPILWHIPKTGGTTVQDIAGACHGKVIACEIGVKYGHWKDTELKILQLQRQSYVNVDTTTLDGLIRAKRLRLVRTKSMVDLIVSPYLHEVDQLFGPPFVDGQIRGRVVTMFRHPIERAISTFNYLQIAHWEPSYRPEMQGWTVEQYATSDVIEDNWMTRQLAHVDSSTPLNMGHLQLAMDIIRRKVFVGLMSRFEESLERFEAVFQWKYTFNPTEQEACRESMLTIGSNVSPRGRGNPVPPPGTSAYNFLLSHNKFDMQLYNYAESLFDEQARLVTNIEGGFRFHEASCSKCEVADAGLLD